MQIKKRHTLSINHSNASSSRHSSSDFTSILNESPWERFVDKTKPLVKVLLVVVIIGGSIYGGTLLFGNKDSDKQSTEYASNNTDHQSDDKEKLYQCLDDVAKVNPSPETSDPEFYKKLIDGYDKRLGCYEKYPGIDLAGKSQVEENRKSAIDSSGEYKKQYLAGRSSNESKSSSGSIGGSSGKFNPNACDSQYATYETLKKSAEQKKVAYDNSFNSSHDFGYFYDRAKIQTGGNIPTAQLIAEKDYTKQQEALQSMQDDWSNTLKKSNSAYESFQACKSASYNN